MSGNTIREKRRGERAPGPGGAARLGPPDPVDSWGQPADTTWTSDLHDPYLWAEPAR